MSNKAAANMGLGAILLMTAGCSEPKHHFSGFLEDYSRLEPSAIVDGASSYWNPDADWSRYRKIFVRPVAIHFAHPKDEAGASAHRVEEYKAFVASALADALDEHGLSAAAPGNNTADIRLQVVNVRLTRIIDSPRTTYRLKRYQMGSMNAEAELIDPETGTVLVQYVGPPRRPEWVESLSEKDAWESLKSFTRDRLREWAAAWAPKFKVKTGQSASPENEEAGQ